MGPRDLKIIFGKRVEGARIWGQINRENVPTNGETPIGENTTKGSEKKNLPLEAGQEIKGVRILCLKLVLHDKNNK